MTGSACRSTRSGWNGDGSHGRRRPTAWWGSPRRSWPTCSTESIGGTRAPHSVPAPPAEHRFPGAKRAAFVIPCRHAWRFAVRRYRRADAALHAATARALRVEAELAIARAKASDDEAIIAHQRLQIAKLRRALHGQRSERAVLLLDQMELGFEELESAATEDEIAAELAAARTTNVIAFVRKRPSRQPFPSHLPRGRVVEAAPAACLCC